MDRCKKREVIIAGAGLIGSAMALALASRGIEVTVIDESSEQDRTKRNIGRTYALSRTSRNLLKNLDLWDLKKLNVSPIKKIMLSAKNQSKENMRHLVEFQTENNETDPSSYMIEDRYLRAELIAKIKKNNRIQLINSRKVLNDETDNYETKVKFSDGSSTSSPILIISDGRESGFAKRLEKRVFKKNYHQAAIVGNIAHDNDHKCTAHQLFLPGGPLAILPLAGKRSTFVWSLPQERGNILNGFKNLSFLNHLKDQIGDTLINLSLIQEKKMFPLYLKFLRNSVDDRKVFIGDSAQSIHPLAGQGLNIGLRDVAALADVLSKGKKLGLDLGSADLLGKYDSWRSFDRISLVTYTDLINTLFSNNNFYLRTFREFGMNVIDNSKVFKNFFIKEAAGEYGTLPELLQ
jgi:2-octaprenyl-6-methoxyphenol hydroxylase